MYTLIANKVQYAKRITQNEGRVEAAKRKMESEFLASTSNSEEEDGQGSKKKKNRKIDVEKEAQEAHKKMDSVKSILSKVDLYLDKAKKQKSHLICFLTSDNTQCLDNYCQRASLASFIKPCA